MILNDFYRYERVPNQKNKSRLVCNTSTKSYDKIELVKTKREGLTVMHITPFMDSIKASRYRKGMFRVTVADGSHITSIYSTDWERGYAYGDFQHTTDLMLLVFHHFCMDADGRIAEGAVVELFIARGKKFDKDQINNLFLDGELDTEMENLRAATVTKSVTE